MHSAGYLLSCIDLCIRSFLGVCRYSSAPASANTYLQLIDGQFGPATSTPMIVPLNIKPFGVCWCMRPCTAGLPVVVDARRHHIPTCTCACTPLVLTYHPWTMPQATKWPSLQAHSVSALQPTTTIWSHARWAICVLLPSAAPLKATATVRAKHHHTHAHSDPPPPGS